MGMRIIFLGIRFDERRRIRKIIFRFFCVLILEWSSNGSLFGERGVLVIGYYIEKDKYGKVIYV